MLDRKKQTNPEYLNSIMPRDTVRVFFMESARFTLVKENDNENIILSFTTLGNAFVRNWEKFYI